MKNKLLTAITLIASLATIGSIIYNAQASAVPAIQALFETSLQASITTNATSATLVSGADLAGNLLNGYYCFTVDAGTTQNEFMCGNASGTALTNLVRGVNPALGISSNVALEFAHRRGADVKITDAPYLSVYSNIFNGLQSIPAALSYDATVPSYSITGNPYAIPDYQLLQAYVNQVATSGAADASQSSKGLVQIGTTSTLINGVATSTDGVQTLWNVLPTSLYGKTYGPTPTVSSLGYNSSTNATGTASTTYTFSYTGANASFNLAAKGVIQSNGHSPSSSVSLVVTLDGASGAQSDNGSNGGLGGQSIATIASTTVPLGTTMYYSIGGQGNTGSGSTGGAGGFADGSNGGGGGSRWAGGGGGSTCISTSTISTCSTPTALMIGGGGAGGGSVCSVNGGNGGSTYGGAGTCNNGGGATGGSGLGFANSSLTSIATSTGQNTGNGTLTAVYTYTYNDPAEHVISTASGTNYAATITVATGTVHLTSQTTSTIYFGTWLNNPTGVVCEAQPFSTGGGYAEPVYESVTSVEYLFSASILSSGYENLCQTY